MAYNSLLGYAKDGDAEVVAMGPRDDINKWALDAYRNLKFYSPVTGDLLTWLEANAVKVPLTGTWVFNSTLTNMTWSSTAFAGISGGTIRYLCNGIEYDNISWNADALVYGTTEVYNRDTKTWKNEVYRTITFTQPLQYQRSEEFVRWFVDNAAPPPSDIMPGNYQFNLRLTSMPFAKDTNIPVNFKCFFGGSGEPKYVTHDELHFKTSSMSNYIDYKLVGSSISNGVYTWDYDGEAQNSWGNQAYRTITLTTPIKYADNPEFYNWFVENTYSISKVLPAGTYLLKDNNDIDTKGYAGKDLEGVILFKSNNSIYSLMMVLYIPNLLMYDKTDVASSATWHDQNYRTIETFYEQPITEDFYNWFMANIIVNPPKPELSGTYLFNAELTVPILSDSRPLVDGTNDALSVGASPIFITNSAFECGGVSYESMGFQNNRLESKGTPHFTFIYSPVSGNDSRVYNPTIDQDDGWSDESYRTVTFTTPFPRSSNTWFYDWFIQNTTKQS